MILEISNFTFDQFKHKITQERRKYLKYFLNDPNYPIFINLERDIVVDIRTNPKIITSSGSTFKTSTKKNIDYLTLEVERIKKELANVRHQNEKILLENQNVSFTSSSKEGLQSATLVELKEITDNMK